MDGARRLLQPPCSDVLLDDDIRAERDAEQQRDDEADDRDIVADGRHGCRALKPAEHHRVRCVE